jgi:serine/threonine-protein kinase RsbW
MTIDSDLSAVATLASATRGVFQAFDAEGAIELELCLIEAVNNAIEHAYRNKAGHRVRVYIATEQDEIVVAVLDNGTPMPSGALDAPTVVPEPDPLRPETLPERGMGLRLLKLVMDEVHYETGGGVNRLVMRRQVRGETAMAPPASLRRASGQ